MRQLLQRLNPFKKNTTQAQPPPNKQELAQFSQQIHGVCDSVEVKNLKLVSNTIESTSGHNNHYLVKAAAYYVKECVWVFNSKYAGDYSTNDYFKEFIVYIKEVQNNFDKHHYDPDGVGGGTITDIIIKLGSVSLIIRTSQTTEKKRMALTPIKSNKCTYKLLNELLYQLDCSMDDELIAGIDTLSNILKHNSYAELSALYQQHSAHFNINELLYFAWAGCEDALLDINQNLNSQDGEILFITAISLAHLNQEEGFTLLNALCANKVHVIMNEDDIYLSLSEHIQFVQHPKAREIEEKYLKNHPNNIFLE